MWGKVTDGSLDRDNQRVDPDWAAKKLREWFEDYGAPLRIEHNYDWPPAGKGLAVDFAGDGPYLRARVAEPRAVKAVRKGLLNDFSIGMIDPPIYADDSAPGGRIGDPDDDSGWVHEVSLTGIGANRNSHFVIAKRAEGAPRAEVVEIMEGDEGLGAALVKAAKGGRAKRDFNPNVGGGVDRDKVPAEDFAGKDRSYPIVKPGDVSDAAESIGRAGPDNYSSAELKANIIRIATRKGPEFVAALPAAWRKEKGKMAKAAKDDGVPQGDAVAAKCKACKGAKTVDGEECPVCHGTGKVKAKKAAKSEGSVATTGPTNDGDLHAKGHDPADEKVTEALGEAHSAIGDAEAAQAADTDKGRKGKSAELAPEVLVHALLCPATPVKVLKSAGIGVTPEAIDPNFFAGLVSKAAAAGMADEAAAAGQAWKGATRLATVAIPDFQRLRKAAAKAFADAYPDATVEHGIISPEHIRRPFLEAAKPTSELGTPARVPASHPLDPESIDRGPLPGTAGYDLAGGDHSVVGKGARDFYTNSAKDMHASAAAMIHDQLASLYPGLCPMSAPLGTGIDSDGQIGVPAEFNVERPGASTIDAGGTNTLTPVTGTGKANKAAAEAAAGAGEDLRELVEAATAPLRKQLKRLTRDNRRLSKAYQEVAVLPDPRHAAPRTSPFRPVGQVTPEAAANLDEARKVSRRVRDRNAQLAAEGVEQLAHMGLSPDQFADAMTKTS